jgi:7-keto-8-aminopelargonate synthetase and related enzymes
MNLDEKLLNAILQLKNNGMFREIPQINGYNKTINGMLNLSSNDYLGLLNNHELVLEFFNQNKNLKMSSASSRLLTGNCNSYNKLEDLLTTLFNKEAALVFNSGYHANIGILPALADKDTLIIADKLVHASIIDGIKLSGCKFERYKHNDYEHLNKIICREKGNFKYFFVVTESVFSMDGDIADLKELVKVKKLHENIILYLDEAHAFGVIGEKGLGVAERENLIKEIDLIVGTFGKAISSVGSFLVCSRIIKEYLINKMRPLIFSTTLPQINIEWSYFIIKQLNRFNKEREHLSKISLILRDALNVNNVSQSHIIPYIVEDAKVAVELSERLKKEGFYALPIRPPTVPPNSSRVRFSLTANILEQDIYKLVNIIK